MRRQCPKKRNKIKVRREWRINPVERVHSNQKKPDIPAKDDIEEQLDILEDGERSSITKW
jgi:hypothetical protein